MCRLLKSICVHILLKLTLMESWKSHLHKHASHIAHPPYTNTLNCRIVATLLRLHWTSLNPHKHTLILVESFLDYSYSKLRLTHSPAYTRSRIACWHMGSVQPEENSHGLPWKQRLYWLMMVKKRKVKSNQLKTWKASTFPRCSSRNESLATAI